MADPAGIEALQARLRAEAAEVVRCDVLRRLLVEFDPSRDHVALTYRNLLQRAQAVLTLLLECPNPESPLVTQAVEDAYQLLADRKEGD